MIPQTYIEHLRYKLNKNLKRGGVLGTLKVCARKAGEFIRELSPHQRRFKNLEKEFDRRYGVKTDCSVNLEDLDVADRAEFRNHYQPTPASALQPILKELQINYEEFIFVDLGSGMGRALLIASEFPFKKIIGVEFSSEINSIARQNISSFRSDQQKCHDIESLCVDATEYALPAENTVFYLYNPFQMPVMQAVLQNIRHSIEIYPREVLVIYYNDVISGLPKIAPFLREICKREATPSTHPFVIYRAVHSLS